MTLDFQRSKSYSDSLLERLAGKGRVLIVVHDNPDPDALAAAMALKHLITMKKGLDPTITFGGTITRAENTAMVCELEIDLLPLEQVDVEKYDFVCMVDTQPGAGNSSFPADAEVHLVIDHHHPQEKTKKVAIVDIREEYGTTASMLYEYLVVQNIDIWTKLATILFYAIKSETQDLGREWSPADRTAYLSLLPMANNRILYEITHPKTPRNYFSYFNTALESAQIYDSVLFFNLGPVEIPEMVAEMADFLLRSEGVDLTFGIGCFQNEGIVSARTSRRDLPLGRLLQKLMAGYGTAGGHGMMAGGQVHFTDTCTDHDIAEKGDMLLQRLLDEIGQDNRQSVPLISG